MALINARSIANKSFILKDFFTSQGLDVLFITETWVQAGDSSSLTALCPGDCSFFSSPRTSGKKTGGGLVTVF